jgi:hypothetical protein
MADLVHLTPERNARRVARSGVAARSRGWFGDRGVYFRYGTEPRPLEAAQAVAVIRDLADPRGFEIFVPRPVTTDEVRHIRRIPPGVGWRYQPDAHGRRPCTCPVCMHPGTVGAAKLRSRFPGDPPPPTKPELMADLRAATTPDEIINALQALGGRRRGGNDELAYLADHPDPQVREVLAEVLESDRGRPARALRERLAAARPAPEEAPQ